MIYLYVLIDQLTPHRATAKEIRVSVQDHQLFICPHFWFLRGARASIYDSQQNKDVVCGNRLSIPTFSTKESCLLRKHHQTSLEVPNLDSCSLNSISDSQVRNLLRSHNQERISLQLLRFPRICFHFSSSLFTTSSNLWIQKCSRVNTKIY